jgi:hypothetical protein
MDPKLLSSQATETLLHYLAERLVTPPPLLPIITRQALREAS